MISQNFPNLENPMSLSFAPPKPPKPGSRSGKITPSQNPRAGSIPQRTPLGQIPTGKKPVRPPKPKTTRRNTAY